MKKLDDITISKAIIQEYMNDFLDYTDMDVAIGGEALLESLPDIILLRQDIRLHCLRESSA